MYDVVFSATARSKLKKQDTPIRKRIISTLERIRTRPERFVRRIVGCPYYRLRAGDHRVILDIKKDKLIILVITIGHRKNVYESV
jgi:mRNA interferase RelE/StbE